MKKQEPKQLTLKEHAIDYADRGNPVFPCVPNGKSPIHKGGYKNATTDTKKISEWWDATPNANIGIPTGSREGIGVTIDVDVNKDGSSNTWPTDEQLQNSLEKGTRVDTPRGGMHYHFNSPESKVWRNSTDKIAKGVDVRGKGGYVLVPPSIVNGKRYTYANPKLGLFILPFPEAEIISILDGVKRTSSSNASSEDVGEFSGVIEEGSRNDSLFRIACQHVKSNPEADLPEVISYLQGVNPSVCNPPMDDDEVHSIAQSSLNYSLTPLLADKSVESTGETLILPDRSPLPLAQSFLSLNYKDKLKRLGLRRYNGKFYQFNGKCYDLVEDDALKGELYNFLEKVLLGKDFKAFNPRSKDVNEVLKALGAKGCLVSNKLSMPVWLTKGEHPSPRSSIVVENGILDLDSMVLHPSTPDYFAENLIPVRYDPDAPMSFEWIKVLKQWWGDDQESIDCLQEIFGYLLVADTSQQKVFMLIGPTRSGKGTVARVLGALIGTGNVCAPTLTQLTRDFGLQGVIGKSVAIISDARISSRTDKVSVVEHLLSISGEDRKSIPQKHREDWVGTLNTRFFLMSNEVPELTDSSGAMASRFISLKMKKSFLDDEDTDLSSRLIAELPSILNWSIEGWKRLNERGCFVKPQSSMNTAKKILELGSPIKSFIEECCSVGAGEEVVIKELFEAWQEWCLKAGKDYDGKIQQFGREFGDIYPEIEKDRKTLDGKRLRSYLGISLKPTFGLADLGQGKCVNNSFIVV